MSHQDHGSVERSKSHTSALRQFLTRFLSPADFSAVRFREDCTWTPTTLAATGLLSAWSDQAGLTGRFQAARKITKKTFPAQQEPATSFQAFTKLLRRWTGLLAAALVAVFREQMRVDLAGAFRVAGWTVFAVDGSRVELPRTKSNEDFYACHSCSQRPAKKRPRRQGKKKSRATCRRRGRRPTRPAVEKKLRSPQAWLTTLWHVGSGLPWDWRSGPSDSSEREHCRQMIAGLPANALLTADAGFVGYAFWRELLEAGHQFVIRVGSHVRLLKHLGYAREKHGTVYLWPDKAASRREPPLVLRLIVVHNGKHPVYLVTSVCSCRSLSDRQATEIYRLRWGIEVFYRHFKQTFQRRKLLSKSADNVPVELTWSLLALWALCLCGAVRLQQRGETPERLSVALALRAIRLPMREYKSRPDHGESLWELLDQAVRDRYKRTNKSSRDYPRKKQKEPAAGPPHIRAANRSQTALAAELKKGLTA